MPVEVRPIVDRRRQSLQTCGLGGAEVGDDSRMLRYEFASLLREGSYT
jgi:hypothetical protein